MHKKTKAIMTLATALFALDATAQSIVVDEQNTEDEINIRNDGGIDRSIGSIVPGEVEQAIHFRQRYYGNVEATLTPNPDADGNFQLNSVATGNLVDADVNTSILVKGKQRLRGEVRSRLEANVAHPGEGLEVKLNAAAFGNSLTLQNSGTQIINLKQRNDGSLVEATIIGNVIDGEDQDTQSNAIALSNNFSTTGSNSNFGGDINQRSDADVAAFNQTSGVRQTNRVQSAAFGNSISITRK